MIRLDDPIGNIPGVGKKRQELYNNLGIFTVGDLLSHYPWEYTDLSTPVNVADSELEHNCCVRVTIESKQTPQRIRQGLTLYKATAFDDTDRMSIVIYNNRYAFDDLKEGETYRLYGKMNGNLVRREMNSPMVVRDDDLLIRPKYHLTEGLTAQMMITNVKYVLDELKEQIPEFLPDDVRAEFELAAEEYAVRNIHFPETMHAAEISRRRLEFDELVVFTSAMRLLKAQSRSVTGCPMKDVPLAEFERTLPFEMTGAQRRVCGEIYADMCSSVPMNRMVQGDVGSGKTAVAAAACFLAHRNGYQAALMAPTEILAAQHAQTLSAFLAPLGIKVGLLTGSMTAKQKNEVKAQLADGSLSVVTGTHALISASTEFAALGLIITDEQHRFGVEQRKQLAGKGDHPHKLVMSATPIPRTLGLIIYGDLDISIIDEMPKGRQKIETYAVTGKLRQRALNFVRKEIDSGHQAYIVCPMIDEDPESEMQSVISYAQSLRDTVLGGVETGLLHGRLPAEEKERIMSEFKAGNIRILVSTTVIEVGMDVPNATVIMIESADRFGLAQLHQLRGRVGRGRAKSYCVLLTDNPTDEVVERLKVISGTSDGFAIAEEDLRLRGAGEFFGVRQSGTAQFKLANIYDKQLLADTNKAVGMIFEKSPDLSELPILREKAQKLSAQNGTEGMN
ncbi:MAG: ATP-dependent DNA helicase RecG [Oscillospiraceae bacterium]|nr:ATP-dependent DNA helicase RecG [Oscillospiraceae bacterium]